MQIEIRKPLYVLCTHFKNKIPINTRNQGLFRINRRRTFKTTHIYHSYG